MYSTVDLGKCGVLTLVGEIRHYRNYRFYYCYYQELLSRVQFGQDCLDKTAQNLRAVREGVLVN